MLSKRRQSELPSDLIDWEAPEMPELDKQRIIYETLIKEIKEENEIDKMKIIEDSEKEKLRIIEQNEADKLKILEESETEKFRIREENEAEKLKIQEENEAEKLRLQEEKEVDMLMNEQIFEIVHEVILEQHKENGSKINLLLSQLKQREVNLVEKEEEANHNLELYIEKKVEVEDFKKKIYALKNQLMYYKKLAK